MNKKDELIDDFNLDGIGEDIDLAIPMKDLEEKDAIVIEKTEEEIEKMSDEEATKVIVESIKKEKTKAKKEVKKEEKIVEAEIIEEEKNDEVSIEKIEVSNLKEEENKVEEPKRVKIKVKNQHHGRLVVSENKTDGKKIRKQVFSILFKDYISVDELDLKVVELVKNLVGKENVEIIK